MEIGSGGRLARVGLVGDVDAPSILRRRLPAAGTRGENGRTSLDDTGRRWRLTHVSHNQTVARTPRIRRAIRRCAAALRVVSCGSNVAVEVMFAAIGRWGVLVSVWLAVRRARTCVIQSNVSFEDKLAELGLWC